MFDSAKFEFRASDDTWVDKKTEFLVYLNRCLKFDRFSKLFKRLDVDHNTFVTWCERAFDTRSIDQGDMNGRRAVHLIAFVGTPALTEVLISNNTDVTVLDNQGFNPAHYCAMSDNVTVLERLYRAGTEVFAKAATSGRTPLHIAASCGSLKVVRFLCRVYSEKGYDPFSTDSEGKTPLWLATFYKHNRVCSHLNSISCTNEDMVSRDNINYLFRACVKTPKFAIELMKSDDYSHFNKFRQTGNLWFRKITELSGGEQLVESHRDLTLGYINMFGIHLNITPEPYFKHYIDVCWNKFARRLAYIELSSYFFFSILSTALYLIYGMFWRINSLSKEEMPTKNMLTGSLMVLAPIWGVCILVFVGFDMRDLWHKWRYHVGAWKHEARLLQVEKSLLHPFMVNMALLLADEENELNKRKGIIGLLSNAKYSLFNLLIHVISLFIGIGCLLYYLLDPTHETSSLLAIFGMSTMLALIWYSTFILLRLIPQTGAFIVALVQMCYALAEFTILYIVAFVPFACIFLKTIFSWSTFSEKLGVEIAPVSANEAFYKTFRMSVADYSWSDGGDLAGALNCIWWYNILLTAWIILSNIVLVNLLIALMGSKFNRAYEKIIHYSLQNQLWWCHDKQTQMSPRQRAEFREYLCGTKCSPYVYIKKSDVLPPSELNSMDNISKTLDDLVTRIKFKIGAQVKSSTKKKATSTTTNSYSSSSFRSSCYSETDYKTETEPRYI